VEAVVFLNMGTARPRRRGMPIGCTKLGREGSIFECRDRRAAGLAVGLVPALADEIAGATDPQAVRRHERGWEGAG